MRRAGIRLKKKASTPPVARNITTAVRKRREEEDDNKALRPARGAGAGMIHSGVSVCVFVCVYVCVYVVNELLRKEVSRRSEPSENKFNAAAHTEDLGNRHTHIPI